WMESDRRSARNLIRVALSRSRSLGIRGLGCELSWRQHFQLARRTLPFYSRWAYRGCQSRSPNQRPTLARMILHVAHALAAIFGVLALCGAGFLLLTVFAIVRWKQVAHPPPTFTPPISILKSLRGVDRGMYEAFRSHCLQDYPDFELIFGVSDPHDEAIVEVEKLMREFPDRRISLLRCPEQLGTNGKVSTLLQMLPHAQ